MEKCEKAQAHHAADSMQAQSSGMAEQDCLAFKYSVHSVGHARTNTTVCLHIVHDRQPVRKQLL